MKFVYYMQCKTAAKANFMEKSIKNPPKSKESPLLSISTKIYNIKKDVLAI